MKMIQRYSDEQIAGEVHAAIKGLRDVSGDPRALKIFGGMNPTLRVVSLRGVLRVRGFPTLTPRQHHEGWLDDMADFGWRYGQLRDEIAMTHPNLVGWDELPPTERHKDEVGLLLVSWMAGLEWSA